MRKIEIEMNEAIRNGHAWSKDNTSITYNWASDAMMVFLHGNHIATVTDNELKLYSGGGWFTPTTKSRLNALINEFTDPVQNGIFQKNYNWFLRAFGATIPFSEGITIPIV